MFSSGSSGQLRCEFNDADSEVDQTLFQFIGVGLVGAVRIMLHL
jgi:hypothetical protein